MKKITVICAPGVGDALIMHIVSYHLCQAGYDVTTSTPHSFGKWLCSYQFGEPEKSDEIFLQHDNSIKAKTIHTLDKPVYTFYGSHQVSKHGPLRPLDYVCNPNITMVDNVIASLQKLFQIRATKENGLKPPPGLIHRRYKKRIAIHTSSANPDKIWPKDKFLELAEWLQAKGYEPAILPTFSSLEDLTSFIYESGYFIGNDSGPGHIASCLQIPHLIIGKSEKQMRLWRPGWGIGEVVVPAPWIPNWKGFRLRETYWKELINTNSVIKILKNKVLHN